VLNDIIFLASKRCCVHFTHSVMILCEFLRVTKDKFGKGVFTTPLNKIIKKYMYIYNEVILVILIKNKR